jgi:hypothetical protein
VRVQSCQDGDDRRDDCPPRLKHSRGSKSKQAFSSCLDLFFVPTIQALHVIRLLRPLFPLAFHNNCMRIVIDLDISLVNSHLIHIAKNGRNLLQRQPIRVWEEDPHDDAANGTGDDEAEIELPPDRVEGRRGGLQPDYVHERDHGNTETDALGTEVRGENLAQVRELRAFAGQYLILHHRVCHRRIKHTIIKCPIEHLEDIKHSNSSLQCSLIVGRDEVGNQCCLQNKCKLRTEYTDGHELGPWEEIYEKCTHDVHTQ